MGSKQIVCIVCPVGCTLKIAKELNEYSVNGNKCAKGKLYAIEEETRPTRIVTSTVKIANGHLNRLPVKTSSPIPKKLVFKCMEEIKRIEVEAPIRVGEVLVNNVLGSDVNIIASRSMYKE
ncbi:DUF1667 domain-containing protein [Serpentinicella sp. ANB-PHB4]|uniref:DUF1667 domain-containing protein n=1 Tax=Serpentinicella sp. ANB-PHB4 TaxID=3074076 RepID=UPI0028575458|nr:DUF1667 domain-containing protein [Serpentinicella sp. ANB-PHB4]MDR5659959.1 DUF1667 domain-containing protein [Serpentinicella sp. ANB-PHB4]